MHIDESVIASKISVEILAALLYTHSVLMKWQRKPDTWEVRNISIRRKRTEANMTQVELAKALGVNQSAVTQWESGLTSPRLDKLQAMAALFKCSLDELVREDE